MKCCVLMTGISSPAFLSSLSAFEILALAVVVPLSVGLFLFQDKLVNRIIIFALAVSGIYAAQSWWSSADQPERSTRLAVEQLNGGNSEMRALRGYESAKDATHVGAAGAVLMAAGICFGRYVRAGVEKFRSRIAQVTALAAGLAVTLALTGCVRAYDRPEYVEIDTSETGFLIPLEGENTQQAKFQSEEYLKQRKIATKRVQITHRWSQEGRWPTDGRWISTVRLVKVNRSPVTREWINAQGPATSGLVRGIANDKAIWIESADSVGFSMGFTCTAFISEDDAARFLYWYPSGSLADMMDREVRGRIQQSAAEVAARYPLDQLRSKKQEIADAVKADVTKFFTNRGVTVTTVGMFGGMTYENPEIQKSIDQTFIAQQLKVVSEAKYEAQKRENDRIKLEADAAAEKSRREAQGQGDARKVMAAAEGAAIREVNAALNETQQPQLLSQLRALEVEKARVEKWDGKYPTYYLGGGTASPNLLVQMPAGGPVQAVK